jgi:TonB-linked SusC/RagA family outer membrane protein
MLVQNWQDYIYHAGVSYNGGASVSGGTKKGSYYVSMTMNDINGIVDNSRVTSGNLRVNLSQHVSKNFKVDARVSLYLDRNQFAQAGSKQGGNAGLVRSTLNYSPLIGDLNFDFQNDFGMSSPLAWIHDFEDFSTQLRTQGALTLSYNLPVKGLKFQVRAAGDIWQKERRKWEGLLTYAGDKDNGRLGMSGLKRYHWNIDNLLMYYRTFNRKHSINATLGYVFQGNYREDSRYTVIDFTTYQFTIHGPQYGQVASVPYTLNPSEEMMNAFLFRANYSFNHKYSLTTTFRADGSSKFAKGNRYSYFPSFSAAWRISEERFMQNADAISSLKLRVGWGLTGNQAIHPYQTFSNFAVSYYPTANNGMNVGFVPTNIANPGLKWETTSQFNIGIDYGMFNDRLTAVVDFYTKKTYDLLQNLAIPNSTGYSKMMINRGTISNKGIDISLTGVAIAKKDIYLSFGGNISVNRNRIEELGIPESPVFYPGDEVVYASYYLGNNVSSGNTFKFPVNIFMVGQPIGMLIGYQSDGIIQEGDQDIPKDFQPGDVKVIDQNGDGKIDVKDRVIIGDPNPDFTYGCNIDFSYKRFSFSLQGYGVYGNEILNGQGMDFYTAEGFQKNIFPAAYHEAWRPDRPSNAYPRILYSEEGWAAATDRLIEDGSYFRITNITLGYDIPVKKHIQKLHVYASLNNLLTITGYSGYDPNITSFMYDGSIMGVDWNPFPYARTFVFGLNVNF